MSYFIFKFLKQTILMTLCLLSLAGVMSGLLLSVNPSPRDQALFYVQLSDVYVSQLAFAQAETMLEKAVSYQPYDQKIWEDLQNIQQKKISFQQTNQSYGSFAAVTDSIQ